MNNSILDSILHMDACFYPELQRITVPNDLLDIYNAKSYLKRLAADVKKLLPRINGRTLLNGIVQQYNSFIKCFSSYDLLLSFLPTLVSAYKLSHNRQFDSLWGILNLFSSFNQKTIDAAFIMLADYFEQILAEFVYLGFPSLKEGLAAMDFLLQTVGGSYTINSHSISSVYLYLIRILQAVFLQQPLCSESPEAFFNSFGMYLGNKYPDGFDRIYSYLRSSFMLLNQIEYRKELFYINESNFITNSAPFRIDRLFQDHFVSRYIEKQKDPVCAYYAIINYVINVFVEVFVLTGEQNIESGLLHMHDAIYRNDAISYLYDDDSMSIEAENMHIPPTQLGIIQDLQNNQAALADKSVAEQSVEMEDFEAGLPVSQLKVLCGYSGNYFMQHAAYILRARQMLAARRYAVHQMVYRFVARHLDTYARLGGLTAQMRAILERTLQRVQREKSQMASPGEMLEILAGGLERINFDSVPSLGEIKLEKAETVSPIAAALAVLSTLQVRVLTQQTTYPNPDIQHLIEEFKHLQTELRVKQLSLRISRTDVVAISAKAIVEAREFYARREQLFERFKITGCTTPEQVMRNSLYLANISRSKFTDYFESLPACACGPLQNVVARLVKLVAEMLRAGLEFGIQAPADVVNEGQSLSQIPIKQGDAVLLDGKFVDIDPGQVYAYYGMQIFVEIDEPTIETWVGGDEYTGFCL